MAGQRRAHVTGAARRFDDRRNTSRVHAIPPNALPEALDALVAFRRREPELVRWILDGHPTLTEAEHLERFGVPYERAKPKR